MILFKQWYGCNGDPNVGLQINPYEIAKGIRDLENNDPMLKGRKIYGIADPSIWDKSRGESVAEMMMKPPYFVTFTPGDNTRLPGKMQFHYRLAFDEYGDCLFQVFNTCKDFIRTFPMLTYSQTKPEDIDTSLEDHTYDSNRYVLQAHVIPPRENVLDKIDWNDPLNQRIRMNSSSINYYSNL